MVRILSLFLLVVSHVGAISARDNLNLGIKTSMTVQVQLERLNRIGFDCSATNREVSEHWQCVRSTQVVNLSPRRILLTCADDSACWPETVDLIRDIAPKSSLTAVEPVTVYRSRGSVHLHCLTATNDWRVCAQSWASSKPEKRDQRHVWRTSSSANDQMTAD